ncbi:MAG: 2-C-methyl-D-erythritol 4-phosphate cytidylyltransferase [Bacteroidota bacterium]
MDYALIVAGGSGKRMGSHKPKQFLLLDKQPVLLHTIKVFYRFSKSLKIIIVLPQSEFSTWESLVKEHDFNIPVTLIAGGETRFDSVKNGLDSIHDSDGLVAIHDGVRPFVSIEVIKKCYDSARLHGSGVAAVTSKDSIRKITGDQNISVLRDDYRLMQTPQTFNIKLIKEAYQMASHKEFTDDASLAESNGVKIRLVEGDYDNLKITTPEDLIIAQALLTKVKL